MSIKRSRMGDAAGIFLLLGAVYFFSLPMTLTEGDAGEWALIAKYGGIPHPSGYPLYAILIRSAAWIFSALPVITSIAIVSAVSAALAAAVSYLTLLRLAMNRWAAAISVLVIFTSQVVWRMATMPEPFALNILLASLVVCVFVFSLTKTGESERSRNWKPFFLMGVLFGLGFCNHHSLVWLLPMPVVVLFTVDRIHLRQNLVTAVLGLMVGVVPLLYFFFARHEISPYDFYTVNNFHDLIRLVLRSDYGSFKLTPHDHPSNSESLIYFIKHLPAWLSWAFFGLILVGLGVLGFKTLQNKGDDQQLYRRFCLGWLLSFLGCGVLFLRMFNVPITSIIPSIIERFMALPMYLLVVPLFFGIDQVYFFLKSIRAHRIWIPLILSACLILHISLQAKHSDRSQATFFEDHTRVIYEMDKIVQGALVSASDPEDFAVLYGRYILNLGQEQPNFLLLSHWGKPAYFAKNAIRYGWPLSDAQTWSKTEVVRQMLNERGKVLVLDIPEEPKPSVFNHSYIFGPGMVLVRPDISLPTDDELIGLNESLLKSIQHLLPSCQSIPNLSSWDHTLYIKYQTGMQNLKTHFVSRRRPDLDTRVDQTLGRLCQ